MAEIGIGCCFRFERIHPRRIQYTGFLLRSVEPILHAVHVPAPAVRIALPVGISFFLFHSMSYTIDVYRGAVAPTRNFIDYACYVLVFPQLVAGPIVGYSYVAKALVSRTVSLAYFSSGIRLFIIGLSKKVLVANVVGELADHVFSLPANNLNLPVAWLGVSAYSIQLYFDFSGYSDMAVGLGRMFGFELPINFNYPYIASSIREFWRRWHISLSSWFRDYVYIPLGGSQASQSRTAFNLLTVFFSLRTLAWRPVDICSVGLISRRVSPFRAQRRRKSLLERHPLRHTSTRCWS